MIVTCWWNGGDEVAAVASPLGLAGTLASGQVTQVRHPVSLDQLPGGELPVLDAIASDVVTAAGDSGGPLVNHAGQVIGINTYVSPANGADANTSTTGPPANSVGPSGFAIPAVQARSVAEDLIEHGSVPHGYLGLGAKTATDSSATTRENGAEIVTVASGGGAEKAGLKVGDVITAIEGHTITNTPALLAAIHQYRIGDQVTVQVKGRVGTITVTLGPKS
ncbi:S1C family serine protease [Frankia sp. R82]|uniref:S1C family serine protease n=1 Tax=Frankia sp. R82 TaxID=2950553 RepID=UPI0020449990|nr:PDZ domain-containing protein [Frankia sp. R82]MCM3882831.1 S1C family serine protease [Frankia sp. R82]